MFSGFPHSREGYFSQCSSIIDLVKDSTLGYVDEGLKNCLVEVGEPSI